MSHDGSTSYKIRTQENFVGGIAIGQHLNEYIGIESSLGYYCSSNFDFAYSQRINQEKSYYVDVKTDYLGIINAILSPVINVNITENTSLYFTAGAGASYIMFSNNIDNWYQMPENSGSGRISYSFSDTESKYYNNA